MAIAWRFQTYQKTLLPISIKKIYKLKVQIPKDLTYMFLSRKNTIYFLCYYCYPLLLQICRNINRIKVCMESGITVILLNLENLYESLYDALNQVRISIIYIQQTFFKMLTHIFFLLNYITRHNQPFLTSRLKALMRDGGEY